MANRDENIVERPIIPYNPAQADIHNKDVYNLYAPVGGLNKVGLVGYNPTDFNIKNQIVSVSDSIKYGFVSKVDVGPNAIIPETIRYDGVDGIKTPNTFYYNYSNSVIKSDSLTEKITVTGSLFVCHSLINDISYIQTEVFSANGETWTRAVKVDNDSVTEVGDFIVVAEYYSIAAKQYATDAANSATQARQYASAADGYKNEAANSASAAANSVTQAATKAGEAANSASAAANSASAAANSATEAADSESEAARFANKSHQSAENAKFSADRAQQIVDGMGGVYKFVGSVTFEQLPATPIEEQRGFVYNITNAFTTDNRFLEGPGVKYESGTNVGVALNGSTYMYDAFGSVYDMSNYAQITGTYSGMTVGKATNADSATKAEKDADNNVISQTYAKQNGTYSAMTVGAANRIEKAGMINSGAEDMWWDFLHVKYSGATDSAKHVFDEIILVSGILDFVTNTNFTRLGSALLQVNGTYIPNSNTWEYTLTYLNGTLPFTRFAVYVDAEGSLTVAQYGTRSEMDIVSISSKSEGFTVDFVGGPESTIPETAKKPDVALPMLGNNSSVYLYNGSDFLGEIGESYAIDEPNIITNGVTLEVGDFVQDGSGTMLRLTTVGDSSGLAIGTLLGKYIPYYLKPRAGIPERDLAEPVVNALVKAKNALQPTDTDKYVKSINGLTGDVNIDVGGATDPEAVKYTPQTLTTEQQMQARTNINAQQTAEFMTSDEIDAIFE